jgi:acyl-CoA synthetase (AMP-forming)/AMP-acid ligase II
MNSPDFMLAWAGLWSIGAAPAMINYNLAGKAFIHCLKISGATMLLVDDEPDLQARVKEVSDELDAEYPMNIIVLDPQTKSEIAMMAVDSPDNSLRAQVKGNWPMCLFYTR